MRANRNILRAVSLAAALLLPFAAGCGGPSGKVPVAGTVTWNGQPLPNGHIVFEPLDAAIAPDAGPIRNGDFSLLASPGAKRVEIHADREIGPPDPVMGVSPRETYLPEKYAGSNSILRATVEPVGENRFTFALTE